MTNNNKKLFINAIGAMFAAISMVLLIGNMKISSNSKVPTAEVLQMTTKDGKFPGIVRLTMKDGRFYCSGAVISDTEVLTAAHCIINMPLELDIESATFEKFKVPSIAYSLNPRADVAIIKGDFSKFSKFKFDSSPISDILVNNYDLAGCGFPYAGELVCYRMELPVKMVDVIGVIGQLYAGMSGGPVIDMNTGIIYAVNHAVTNEMVLIAPIVNLKAGQMIIPKGM